MAKLLLRLAGVAAVFIAPVWVCGKLIEVLGL